MDGIKRKNKDTQKRRSRKGSIHKKRGKIHRSREAMQRHSGRDVPVALSGEDLSSGAVCHLNRPTERIPSCWCAVSANKIICIRARNYLTNSSAYQAIKWPLSRVHLCRSYLFSPPFLLVPSTSRVGAQTHRGAMPAEPFRYEHTCLLYTHIHPPLVVLSLLDFLYCPFNAWTDAVRLYGFEYRRPV